MMTDKEYLRKLYREIKYDPWIQKEQPLFGEGPFARKSVEIAIEEGIIEKNEAAWFKRYSKGMLTPEKFFRGRFIRNLQDMALIVLGPKYAQLRKIPVGLLPWPDLNAFASPTPAGGSVIVLNSSLIPYCGLIYKLLISFAEWHHEGFYSREHSQEEYRHALVALAEFIITKNERSLQLMAEVMVFKSKPVFDKYISDSATMMELFIILHEYGHVACGHLEKSNVRHVSLPGDVDVVVYNKSQQDEFEADMFAFTSLSSSMQAKGNSRAKQDAAMYIGILLKFFELCDRFRKPFELLSHTHPPPSDRWNKIAAAAEVDKYTASFAARLNEIFSVVMHGNPEPPEVAEQP